MNSPLQAKKWVRTRIPILPEVQKGYQSITKESCCYYSTMQQHFPKDYKIRNHAWKHHWLVVLQRVKYGLHHQAAIKVHMVVVSHLQWSEIAEGWKL